MQTIGFWGDGGLLWKGLIPSEYGSSVDQTRPAETCYLVVGTSVGAIANSVAAAERVGGGQLGRLLPS